MALKIDSLLNNRYRIVSILGQGGMGAVYCAKDEHLDILVAVKENLFLSEEYSRQFHHEASILASLRHPYLPRVGDYFALEGEGQYLIMDYIEGEDLRERIERLGTLSEREALLIGASVCEALAYMHSRTPPVIHRDIKPGNIKITPHGEAVLVDFGLAKVMMGSQHTTTGARAMTPGYSPPEQYGTARTDSRSDIYSLGATLYAALTGVIPEDSLSRATGKAQLTAPRKLQEKITRSTETAILKALEIEPEDRHQTAEDFSHDLLLAGNLMEYTRPRISITPPPPGEFPQPSNEEQPEKPARKSWPLQPRKSIPKKKPHQKLRPLTYISMALMAVFTAFVYTRPAMTSWATSLLYEQPAQISNAVNTPTDSADFATLPIADNRSTTQPVPSETPLPTDTPQPLPTETLVMTQEPTPIPSPTNLPANLVGGGYGQITFASDRTGNMQIWTMNSDGSQQRQLTNFTEGACQPAWSPDGQKLAVISPCLAKSSRYYEKARIYIVDSEGSNPVLLPNSVPGDFDPAWSPDGQRIAFTSLRSGVAHIFVYHFDTLILEELSDTRYADFQPSWRPGSRQIAFVRDKPYSHIWVMSDHGQTQFQLSTSGSVNDNWPVWTPDGATVIYTRSQLQAGIPWLLKLNYEDRGKEETRIPRRGEGDLGPVALPSISPDGQWIAYESWPDGRNHDIYLTTLDGTERIRLTTDPGFDFHPVWRPAPAQP